MKTLPLSSDEIAHALTHLPGWAFEDDVLTKTLTFGGFREAMGFMLSAGFEADALDHHPEWTNICNKVTVRLNTHEVGGKVTAKDVELAGRMQKLYEKK